MARLRAQTVQEERERARQQQQEQGQGTGVDGVRVTGETAPKHTFPPNGGHARAGPSANTNGMGDDDIPGTTLSSLNADLLPPPTNKEEGRAQWEEFLRDRFIRGEDDDFDYSLIDDNDEYDVLERQEQEEAWFDEEEPEWASSCGEEGEGGGRVLKGETGVQDF
ncbi:uncharacterized protein CTHT_0011410 [Thermochaetoides thermophila DSM 1495]|jgi:Coiled-coil domain containing protein (DUF2052).|uniref:CCD97-like C-terminal domain-containing protein n=1 Tax=Chaetomium thermophilum (strain DSM 1495 / CBS 144.50 / IMI 039719) TaxID=759272 RepID=G0S0V8_CHATD|nr:hypothetical protein CTHT_0011410 [Thermochaetoides thermophila DSM 1495]EGS22668.1 hypothetical protein CTHT_0011410 [Thermochaetoides thermophila DSM 1495]